MPSVVGTLRSDGRWLGEWAEPFLLITEMGLNSSPAAEV